MPGEAPDLSSEARPPAAARSCLVPLLRHTAALGVLGHRMGAAVQLGERGASKSALPKMGGLIPGMGEDPSEPGGFFLEAYFPPEDVFLCPLIWVGS